MISRHRLRGRRRFAAVRRVGLRASSAGLRAQLAHNGLAVARVGFVLVGVRSSVQRNRLRRRLRAAIRPRLASLAGHDVVLVAGADAASLSFGALSAAVETSTSRALLRLESADVASTTDNGSMTTVPESNR